MSMLTRRRAILAAAGVVGLAVAVTMAPVEAATRVAYAPCAGVTAKVNDSEIWFVPSTRPDEEAYDCVLGRGNAGFLVHYLQDVMNLCYGEVLAADGVGYLMTDGIYGAKTKRAMKAVQRSIGVADDGVYGPDTQRGMAFHRFGRSSYDAGRNATGPVLVAVNGCATTGGPLTAASSPTHWVAIGEGNVPLFLPGRDTTLEPVVDEKCTGKVLLSSLSAPMMGIRYWTADDSSASLERAGDFRAGTAGNPITSWELLNDGGTATVRYFDLRSGDFLVSHEVADGRFELNSCHEAVVMVRW